MEKTEVAGRTEKLSRMEAGAVEIEMTRPGS
jgi:hypothetical protein